MHLTSLADMARAPQSAAVDFSLEKRLVNVIKASKKFHGNKLVTQSRRIGLLPNRAALLEGFDTSATPLPPFRERAPWFGGDLQTLRNTVCGAPPDLPGGERLLLPMHDGDRLAARLDQRPDFLARPLIVLVHGLAGSEASGYMWRVSGI